VRRAGRVRVVAGVLLAVLGASGGRAQAGQRTLEVRVLSNTRDEMVQSGAVLVRARARPRARVRITARAGPMVVTRSRVVLLRPRARTVRLALTRIGRAVVDACLWHTIGARARRLGSRRHRSASRPYRCNPPPAAAPPQASPPLCPACPALPLPGSPSGVPMPVGDLPGWKQVFTDDFPGTAVDERKWGPYHGQPAGDPGGWWEPSHVEAGGGVARLRSYRDGGRWVSGGMSSARALSQRYGRYDVRFRMDAGYGIGSTILLWPTADHWPPEIDFAESGGRDDVRALMSATLHYGDDDRIVQRQVTGDFTRWHTMGVEWTPGRLVYTLDGAPWATVVHPGVPDEPMELDVQTQAGSEGDVWTPAPDAGTPPEVDMEIDWVVAYAPEG
jgi:hypothetical protein